MMTAEHHITRHFVKNRANPLEFDPRFVNFARKLALMGCSSAEIARNLAADKGTFYRWMTEYPEFAEAIDIGRMMAKMDVVDALHKRCVGFKVTLTITEKDGRVITREEYYPPDVAACRWWLINRDGQHWKPDIRIAEERALTQPGDLNARAVEYPRKQIEDGRTVEADIRELTPEEAAVLNAGAGDATPGAANLAG